MATASVKTRKSIIVPLESFEALLDPNLFKGLTTANHISVSYLGGIIRILVGQAQENEISQ